MKKNLSVRETEKLVKNKSSLLTKKNKMTKDIDTKNIEKNLSHSLKHNVQINHNKSKENGSINIKYKDLDEFDKICEILFKI